MSISNFKIKQGLDLDGLVLSNINGSLHAGVLELATKNYVDAAAQGLDVKASVKYATTTPLPGTFTSDEPGSPKTFVATANDILLVDGQQVSLGDRVLVKNEDSVINNGIYQVTVVGNDGTRGASAEAAVLVRTSDGIPYDSLTSGAFAFVEFGNTNAGKGFVAAVPSATQITWTQFSEVGATDLTGYVTETGTQDLSNKTIIDTLYFSDSVTIAQEGEIAVKANTHEFEIKANYGDITLETIASPEGIGSNVNISSLYGNIVLDTPAQGKDAYIGSVAAGNEIATKTQVDAKQNTLTAGTGIDITNDTISVTSAPAFISSVDSSFAVDVNGELSLSDAISITSVELTDSAANVTAASDVFGNASTSTYAMGSAVTVGTLPAGADVADVFITLKAPMGAFTHSRTSRLTFVNTGGDAPIWTEYGIIDSGSFPATAITFDSNGNILANVTGSDTYSVKGVVTILK